MLLGLVDSRDADEIRLLRVPAIGAEEQDVERLVRAGLGKDGAVALGLARVRYILLDRRLFDGLVMQVQGPACQDDGDGGDDGQDAV